jgi:hypothetical protein
MGEGARVAALLMGEPLLPLTAVGIAEAAPRCCGEPDLPGCRGVVLGDQQLELGSIKALLRLY